MKQLPASLQPWAAWLTLFAPDLTPALGELLLRLQPLVGHLSLATPVRGMEPAGIGNIVRRGSYERLLMSEWAYADVEPDEFIRRAAGGELLFTGPEPALRQQSLRSVVLFDSGPGQLGAPRLAQLALFILLARRAEQAGAQFSWGLWQQPGILHDDAGLTGLRKLIKSRTLQAPANDASRQWQALFDVGQIDCWLVGADVVDLPVPAGNQVVIRQSLSGSHLQVSLRQRRDHRTLQLPLPDMSTAVRLLREPFAPMAPVGVLHHRDSRPSLTQAPRFSSGGNWVCVAQVGGGAIVYQVPQAKSTQNKQSKHRAQAAPAQGSILAAGVYKPNLSFITAVNGELVFQHFPGPLFSQQRIACERPPPHEFQAPPGMARWLQTFYLISRDRARPREDVLVLDTQKRLVCWRLEGHGEDAASLVPRFYHIADHVIGAHQRNDTLFFACTDDHGVQLYAWNSQHPALIKQGRLAQTGTLLLYASGTGRQRNDNVGQVAIQCSSTSWWLGSVNAGAMIDIEQDASVLGIARSKQSVQPGLVVLHAGKRRIEHRVGTARYELASSVEPIRHASMDGASGRIAWITSKTSSVVVQAIDHALPLLQISCDRGADAT
jgi:hypothetical protein